MALIYIVEDDENILEIEEIALRNANYQVTGFSSARDMYEKLAKIKPDLFLLDIMLPDEDGNYQPFFSEARWYLGEFAEDILRENNYAM